MSASGTSPTLDFDVENVTLYNCGIVGADFQRGGIAIREVSGSTTILDATNVLSVGNTNNDYTVVPDTTGFPLGTANTLDGASPSVTVASMESVSLSKIVRSGPTSTDSAGFGG